jgi:5-methylcytosine-specific restriction endonuclease McrA
MDALSPRRYGLVNMRARKDWNKERRERMIKSLGGKCVRCGVINNLTFDCIRPTGDGHHRMSAVQRMTYYLRQARLGNVQILCAACNTSKGAQAQPAYLLAYDVMSRPPGT